MRPLCAADLVDLDRYEAVRPSYRARVIAHKAERRVPVGDLVTLTFEDRETVRYQIQEMTRIERIRDAGRVQGELDAYNDLVPRSGELSATLFIEIPEATQIRPELDRLVGIDEHVEFVLGDGSDEESSAARFDPKQMEADRISAVQYIRFPLSEAAIARLERGDRARVRIAHPAYRHEGEVGPATRESLLADLRDRPACLLDPEEVADAQPVQDDIVHEDARVRVLRPARPAAPEHWIVEAVEPVPSLVEAEPALLAELVGHVQHLAAAVRERCGSCRVQTDVPAPGTGGERMRWHVLGGPRPPA